MLFALMRANAQTFDYIPWQLSNAGCFGCASFYWKVTKTVDSNVGSNRYDVWFSSNSFYPNGVFASTYVWGIQLYVDGKLLQEPAWLLFKEPYYNPLFSFESHPQPVVALSWEGLKIY